MDKSGEMRAKAAFSAHLKTAGHATWAWRRGCPRPDFYLRVDNSSYAVEVTRAMLTIDIPGSSRTQHVWRAALESLAKHIEARASARGVLSGAYLMRLVPIPAFGRIRRAVVASALEYIETTQSTKMATRQVLARRQGGTPMTIEKVSPDGSMVAGVSVVGPVKRDHHIVADLQAILAERLSTKRHLLSRARLPRILLVVDSYLYGDSAHWREAAAGLDFTGYHTVARVSGPERCTVLMTARQSWQIPDV